MKIGELGSVEAEIRAARLVASGTASEVEYEDRNRDGEATGLYLARGRILKTQTGHRQESRSRREARTRAPCRVRVLG